MTYNLKVIKKTTYLHFIVTGENTKENVSKYLGEILKECVTQNCFRILIEEKLEGIRLGTFDVYSLASEAAIQAFGKLKAVAYVDVNVEGNLMMFAETVAVNRSVPVRVFSSVEDAKDWLAAKDQH